MDNFFAIWHLSVSLVRVTSSAVEENIAQDPLDVRENSDHVLLDLAAQLHVAEVLVLPAVYAGVLQTLRRGEIPHLPLHLPVEEHLPALGAEVAAQGEGATDQTGHDPGPAPVSQGGHLRHLKVTLFTFISTKSLLLLLLDLDFLLAGGRLAADG